MPTVVCSAPITGPPSVWRSRSCRWLVVQAAVIAPANSGEAVFDAMRARSTYATTGERILLEATMNGEPMGRLVPQAEGRRIRCTAAGTEPIEAIDLIKNGEVIYSRSYLTPAIGPEVTVQFSQDSPTEVFEYGRPRGPIGWRGSWSRDLPGLRIPEVSGRALLRRVRGPARNVQEVDHVFDGQGDDREEVKGQTDSFVVRFRRAEICGHGADTIGEGRHTSPRRFSNYLFLNKKMEPTAGVEPATC